LVADGELRNEEIPLLIQKRCYPENAKGHLSNERRCYEENRDWIGEIDSTGSGASSYFKINLRRWRERLPEKAADTLTCPLSIHVSEVLKIPADWAYRAGARIHFEWVWDGRSVYLVQADEELSWDGHDPKEEHESRKYNQIVFTPKCLKRVSESDAERYGKIRNVFVYLQLNLPTAPLYILDDTNVIYELSRGTVPDSLRSDISDLVGGSLVIRTDIATSNLEERQFLARSQELKDVTTALNWIINQSKNLVKSKQQSAFIFHNFIPAQSAAFVYADPNVPFVPIESLWGLPEGLYYNSHDKYVVDTSKADIDLVSRDAISKFVVREKCNFKRFFVSTTPSGKWETLRLKPPFDWKGSLSHDDCRIIAYESRRIAKAEKHPVSIMWFIGVPPSAYKNSAIPWYHEEFDITKSRPSLATKTKTPFDKSYLIQNAKDVEDLKIGMKVGRPGDRIRVRPTEEALLRDKFTLKIIGELARDKGAIIVLEGAVLSHAYYQLAQTGAIVEVVHPFIGFEERHAFNKLVRDRVPEIIQERGESITTALLDSEALVRALREKLVEEAYELLDAKDMESVKSEIADVREVIDALVNKLNVNEDDIEKEQAQKREQRGGFAKGIVLVETENAPPTSKPLPNVESHLSGLQPVGNDTKVMGEAEFRARTEITERRTDRRVAPGQVEIKANVTVPVTRSSLWSAETAEERIEGVNGKIISGRIKGQRVGSQWNYEVSVWIDDTQLELPLGSMRRKMGKGKDRRRR
jgi:predicted house-cleaning noncanonical NTP pyrophosphatase (MazG superfamily)